MGREHWKKFRPKHYRAFKESGYLEEALANAAKFTLEAYATEKRRFGGRVVKGGIPICDILQCYLDLYNLPDRGREQADFVLENILSKIFEKR